MMTVRCRPWSAAGTVLLVGDAAHAMLPYYGQGANAGFEDCAILDDLIDRHGTNWSRVFEEFERARRTDTDAMADLCHEHLTVLRDDVSRPQFQSQWRIEQVLHRLMPDLFTPLYAMIAFSSLSYAEARRRDRLQQQVVRELLHDDSVSRAAVSPAAAAALRQRVRARLGTASAPAAQLPFVGA
jgi:kynurenine 3-monooxygenase